MFQPIDESITQKIAARSGNYAGWQPLHRVAIFHTSADKILAGATAIYFSSSQFTIFLASKF